MERSATKECVNEENCKKGLVAEDLDNPILPGVHHHCCPFSPVHDMKKKGAFGYRYACGCCGALTDTVTKKS